MLILTLVDVAIGIIWWTALAFLLSPVVTRIGTARINFVASALLVIVAIALLAFTAVEHL